VPGCRKFPFPALLSKASDCIAALQMQMYAMASLVQALAVVMDLQDSRMYSFPVPF
jgi:hypothetical protein